MSEEFPLRPQVEYLRAENARLREALEWYGDRFAEYHKVAKSEDWLDSAWRVQLLTEIFGDAGKRAREALGE